MGTKERTRTKNSRSVASHSSDSIDVSRFIGHPGSEPGHFAYTDRERGWCVQVWENATPGCDGTLWAGTLRVAVSHTRAKTAEDFDKREYGVPITWDDLQRIKDGFWPERIAVEVYPPRGKIIDVANVRWLWVLPRGAILPFNLQAGSLERLTS